MSLDEIVLIDTEKQSKQKDNEEKNSKSAEKENRIDRPEPI